MDNSVGVDRASGEIFFYDKVCWEAFDGDSLDWVKTIDSHAPLGPLPEGKSFSRLGTIIAPWSADLVPWLSLPRLDHLMMTSPAPATLEALDGTRLRQLRLERPRKMPATVHWPTMPRLKRLELYGWKTLDLAGANWPALKYLTVDGADLVTNLHLPEQQSTLAWLLLENVRQVEVPARLWEIPAREVTCVGRPSRTPWLVEACCLQPDGRARSHGVSFPPVVEEQAARLEANAVSHLEPLGDDRLTLTFDCANLPVADTVRDLGYASTGEFWTGLLWHRHPLLARRLQFAPAPATFTASGPVRETRAARAILAFLTANATALKGAVHASETVGMDLKNWG
jgi:hypothetical protein